MFSWDTSTNAPDEDETDGRSYISAVSEVITDDSQTCIGRAKKEMGEARMDIEDSEMGYLGYHDSESYGLTWKVRQETVYFDVYSHGVIGRDVIQYHTCRSNKLNCSYVQYYCSCSTECGRMRLTPSSLRFLRSTIC